MDAHCTATGKVLLTNLPPPPPAGPAPAGLGAAPQDRHTITDHAALGSELASIRKNGFA